MLINGIIIEKSIEIITVYERKLCKKIVRGRVLRKIEKVYQRYQDQLIEHEELFKGSQYRKKAKKSNNR